MQLARRHRIEPLAARALAARSPRHLTPAEDHLATAAQRTLAQNLRYAAEAKRLLTHFQALGLSPLFVKGLTLSKLAYGNIALKQGWDIDMLVAQHEAVKACGALLELGYDCTLPGPVRRAQQLSRWCDRSREVIWHHARRGVYLELHTRLVDNPLLIPGIDAAGPRRLVNITTGVALPTLGDEELFSYLCVHGASSCWFRLKWLADLAKLLQHKEAVDIETLYRRSQQLGAGRAADQALLLCRFLFKTNIPPGLWRHLRSSRVNRMLLCLALGLLDPVDPNTELYDRPFGTLPIHFAQFLLMPGWRFKWMELHAQVSSIWRGVRWKPT